MLRKSWGSLIAMEEISGCGALGCSQPPMILCFYLHFIGRLCHSPHSNLCQLFALIATLEGFTWHVHLSAPQQSGFGAPQVQGTSFTAMKGLSPTCLQGYRARTLYHVCYSHRERSAYMHCAPSDTCTRGSQSACQYLHSEKLCRIDACLQSDPHPLSCSWFYNGFKLKQNAHMTPSPTLLKR
jgi:hypothetical protein